MLRELKRIFKDSVIYGLGSVLPKVVNMLLIPVYTRFLSPTDYGILSLAALISTMFGQLLLVGLPGSVTRFYRVDDEQSADDAATLLYTVVLVDMVFSTVVTVLILLFGPKLMDILPFAGSVKFNPYLTIAFLGALFTCPIVFVQAVFRARGRASRHAQMSLTNFALNTGFTLYLVVIAKQGAAGSLLGTTIAAGILAPYALWEMARVMKRHFSWPQLKKSLIYGLPLVPHYFSGWALGYADRLVLERFRSAAEVGMYAVAYSVGMGMSVLATAVNQSWAPTFYDLAGSKDGAPKLKRLTTLYAAAITLIGIAYMLISREMTQILADEKYWSAMPLAPVVVGGYFLQAMYFVTSTPAFYVKQTKLIATISALSAGLNIFANILLIPRWGMAAAAWVTLATFGVMAGGTWIVSSRVRPGSFDHRKLLALVGLFGVFLVAESVVASFGLPMILSLLIKAALFPLAIVSMFAMRIVTKGEAASALKQIAARVAKRRPVTEVDPEEEI